HRDITRPKQLHHKRTHAAGRTRHRHGVARLRTHRTHGGKGRRARDIQRPGHIPRHPGGLGGHLIDRDVHMRRVLGPPVGESDHLVPYGHTAPPVTDRDHPTGEVTTLTGWERRGPALVQHARANLPLPRVDRGRDDLYLDLPPPRHRL